MSEIFESFKSEDTFEIGRKFGEQVKLYSAGEKSFSFAADVQVSKTFLAWCCGFGKSLKITSPASVINELKEYTKELFEHYN